MLGSGRLHPSTEGNRAVPPGQPAPSPQPREEGATRNETACLVQAPAARHKGPLGGEGDKVSRVLGHQLEVPHGSHVGIRTTCFLRAPTCTVLSGQWRGTQPHRWPLGPRTAT